MLIALLMIIGGTLVSQFDQPDRPIWPGRRAWLLNATGVIVALIVFMADAVRMAGSGAEAVRKLLPMSFNWPLFIIALALMTTPIVEVSRKIWGRGADESTTNRRISQLS